MRRLDLLSSGGLKSEGIRAIVKVRTKKLVDGLGVV